MSYWKRDGNKCLCLLHDWLHLQNLLCMGLCHHSCRAPGLLCSSRKFTIQRNKSRSCIATLIPVLLDLRSETTVRKLLKKKGTNANILVIRAWIPASVHQDLFDLSIHWSKQYPTCTGLLVLLEHCMPH
jgi:hypothetical protein